MTIRFAAIGINHPHIHDMVESLLHAGATLASFHAPEDDLAAAFGKRAAAHLHRQSHEVHAGVAFIDEHDLQLYSRRSKFWENHLGDARHHQEIVADEMQR